MGRVKPYSEKTRKKFEPTSIAAVVQWAAQEGYTRSKQQHGLFSRTDLWIARKTGPWNKVEVEVKTHWTNEDHPPYLPINVKAEKLNREKYDFRVFFQTNWHERTKSIDRMWIMTRKQLEVYPIKPQDNDFLKGELFIKIPWYAPEYWKLTKKGIWINYEPES